MNKNRLSPSATSLPRSPQDEAASRLKRYAVTMGIRIACFLLMVLIQPYGWWTWVLAAGAIFLPYIAVVRANAGEESDARTIESPELSLDAPAEKAAESDTTPTVIRLTETRPGSAPAADSDDSAGTAPR
ncbi:DUF3099 domain-containing protein [Microbacterium nymphoidis]|uniref:DUF3099 domain-containing protein n=1 Tax=Microbacterium nymphoidis TaxID=2898586 RepID=UPI001E511A8B|nr:DUF3099 domain-containing protein [Microbacterium nymphoidis]MCD2497314.1 DUF3099 domain-containing protein [Microbacterium nymphoidis]